MAVYSATAVAKLKTTEPGTVNSKVTGPKAREPVVTIRMLRNDPMNVYQHGHTSARID